MDTFEAVNICKNYLLKVKKSNINFSEAWLFGSYAKGNQHENSDIDIALVMNANEVNNFETEVQLMTLRNGIETLIEPHSFSKNEFYSSSPLVYQIHNHGIRIEI